MLFRKLLFSSLIFCSLINIFSPRAFSTERTKTIVTVVKGKVECFEYTGEIDPAITGKRVCIGKFYIRIDRCIGLVSVNRKINPAYILPELREGGEGELHHGVMVLLQENWREETE